VAVVLELLGAVRLGGQREVWSNASDLLFAQNGSFLRVGAESKTCPGESVPDTLRHVNDASQAQGGAPVEDEIVEPASRVTPPTITGLPTGYVYGVTRYADILLQGAFPDRLADLVHSLERFHPTLDELRAGGGGRTVFVARFDKSLADQIAGDGSTVWGKRNITVYRGVGLDGERRPLVKTRGHEIDMFGVRSLEPEGEFPGIAVEMEWNNKDPFYDRDLLNFDALHREGAIAVGVIVTRGPRLQDLIGSVVRSKDGGLKYGQSTTHWNKLVPRVNLGGGGECPLLLIGIEPERITGVKLAYKARELVKQAALATDKDTWRGHYSSWAEAKAAAKEFKDQAAQLLPPVADVEG
jgi:hypothetical protein